MNVPVQKTGVRPCILRARQAPQAGGAWPKEIPAPPSALATGEVLHIKTKMSSTSKVFSIVMESTEIHFSLMRKYFS